MRDIAEIADGLLELSQNVTTPSRRKRPKKTNLVTKAIDDAGTFQDQINQLQQDKEEYAQKISDLTEKNESLSDQVATGAISKRTMPVSKKEVTLKEAWLDPDLVDVSPLNRRVQQNLNALSTSDILPLIEDQGQQEPILVRPKADGRFEAADGSRRLWCAKTLQRPVLADIGDIPSEDMGTLSQTLNTSLETSDYDNGVYYLRERAAFESDNQLFAHFAEVDRVSKSTVRSRCLIARMPHWFVDLFQKTNDISATGIIKFKALIQDKKMSAAMERAALDLRDDYAAFFESNETWPSQTKIISDLMASASVTSADTRTKIKQITTSDGSVVCLKKVSPAGQTRFEIKEASEDQIKKIEDFISSLLI